MVLILSDNVKLKHIIHAVLMINLMVFKEKIEEYNLLMVVMIELIDIVLVQHKQMHNLMKCDRDLYVHAVMHIQQLNLILFEGFINYNLKVLKANTIVKSMHVMATKIGLIDFDIKEKGKTTTTPATTATTATQNFFESSISINGKVKLQQIIQVLLMVNLIILNEYIKKYNLLIVTMRKLFGTVLQHKVLHNERKNGSTQIKKKAKKGEQDGEQTIQITQTTKRQVVVEHQFQMKQNQQ